MGVSYLRNVNFVELFAFNEHWTLLPGYLQLIICYASISILHERFKLLEHAACWLLADQRLVRIAYPYCSNAQYGSAISTANSINRKNHTSQTASLRVVSLDKIHVQWLIERQTLLPMLATKKINQNLLQSTKI